VSWVATSWIMGVTEIETETEDGLAWLAEEQAALRRVATLVASGTPHDTLLRATVDEVRQLLRVDLASVARYHLPDRVVVLYRSADGVSDEVFDMPLGGENVATLVAETLQAARMDDYSRASGPLAEWARREGVRSIVGAPVIVAGRLWGVMSVTTRGAEALPADTEMRLASFTELLAMAIANAESLERLTRLLDEQSALRRLATLIVTGTAGYELLAATADEVREVMRCDFAAISRYLPDDRILTVHWSGEIDFPSEDGEINPLGGKNVSTLVARSGKPARIDSYAEATGVIGRKARASVLGSMVGVPVLVDGQLWGLIVAGVTSDKPQLPSDAETRLERFTELLATGIANAESSAELTASRARVVAASDETRRRIERDLHDGVQQRILSLVLEVQEVQAQRPALQLDSVVDGLNEIQDQLREVTSGLHPAMLAEGGIASALATLARRAPLPVYLDIALVEEPSEPVEVAVYFIVSELITNAAKHAQASRVLVALEASDSVLRLGVEDDGVGGADPMRGSGLLGLSDRVAAMSGAIQLKSPPGEGTAIRVELPLDWTASNPSA
jgi:signal transduction histidine kinase